MYVVVIDSHPSFLFWCSEGSVVVDFKVFMNQTLTTPQPNPPDLQGRVISVMINQAKRGSFGNLTVDSLILKGTWLIYS